MKGKDVNLAILKERWPSGIVSRGEVGRFTGGAICPRTMANIDSKGEGPPNRFKLGKKTCYFVDDLTEWLEERMSFTSMN